MHPLAKVTPDQRKEKEILASHNPLLQQCLKQQATDEMNQLCEDLEKR